MTECKTSSPVYGRTVETSVKYHKDLLTFKFERGTTVTWYASLVYTTM